MATETYDNMGIGNENEGVRGSKPVLFVRAKAVKCNQSPDAILYPHDRFFVFSFSLRDALHFPVPRLSGLLFISR